MRPRGWCLIGAGAMLAAALLWPGPARSAGTGAALLAQSSPGSVEAREHLRRGLELSRQGLHDGAAAELDKYVKMVPGDPDGHYHLGRALLEIGLRNNGPYSRALTELQQALKLDPYRDYIRVQLAEAYGTRKPTLWDPQRAINLYEELLERHPNRYDLRISYAKWLIFSEVRLPIRSRPDQVLQDSGWTMELARHQLEKAIDTAPRDSHPAIEARSFLAEVLFRSGEWDASIAAYKYVLESFPNHKINEAPAWNSIGHNYWRKGNYEEAARAFRKAYEIGPSLAYQFDLMKAYEKMGGYPKDFPERLKFPLREESIDPKNPPDLKFRDIAERLHLDKPFGAGPTGWADYNLDGKMDLVACGCDNFCSLWKGTEDGFVDATIEAKLSRLDPGFGAAWGDYDNDGDPDLYLARNGWNGPAGNALLRNNGDGTFTDVVKEAKADHGGSSFHVAWFDYDRDGWLDLILSNGVYQDGSDNQLFRNLGDGTFENVTARAGLTERQFYGTIGVAVGDYDDDGWPDIFFNGRHAPNRLYHNNGDGTFTNVAKKAGVEGPGTANGFIAFMIDMDSDGDLDIFTGQLAPWDQILAGYRPGYTTGPLDHIPRLFRNNGDGTFSDSSLTAGLRYPIGVMSGGIADLDNDGYMDIYLGTSNPELRRLEPNILYHNRQGRTFEDVTRYADVGRLGKGHGIIFYDWDGDGDLEMFAELGGFYHGDQWSCAFFLNESSGKNHWLEVRLRQEKLNLDSIGARVTAVAGDWKQVQEVTAGRGFGSTDPPILHFGLGPVKRLDRLVVRWPDGETQVLENVEVDRVMRLEHPGKPGS